MRAGIAKVTIAAEVPPFRSIPGDGSSDSKVIIGTRDDGYKGRDSKAAKGVMTFQYSGGYRELFSIDQNLLDADGRL